MTLTTCAAVGGTVIPLVRTGLNVSVPCRYQSAAVLNALELARWLSDRAAVASGRGKDRRTLGAIKVRDEVRWHAWPLWG
jgi:hypothetical protein